MTMLKKEMEQRQAIEMLCTDMLVPKDHLLRKIDAAVDFTYIYSLVKDLYCEDNGRPSCDPVVLFKLVLIQHLFGIRSLRQTMRDVEVNVAYRWFLGYTMSQQLPHFATISYAFRHRFTADVIEAVFRWVLEEVACAGYLSPEVVFIDGTHIKANANMKKQVKKQIPKAARHYQEQLMEEVDADRKDHGKKPLKKDNNGGTPSAKSEEKTITESTTDPDCGVFHKGEHQKCFAYEAHGRRSILMTTRSKTPKATFAPNKASMRPDARGERPTLSLDHRTHGRIKTGKKRFYALRIFTEIKQVLLPIETL